jgi:hypothetical protein
MEFSKKKLLSLLKESAFEVDEMAFKPEGKRSYIDPSTGQPKERKGALPIWNPSGEEKQTEKGEQIPHGFKLPSGELYIPLEGQEEEAFKNDERNKQWLEDLAKEHGDKFMFVNKKRIAHPPRVKGLGTQYTGPKGVFKREGGIKILSELNKLVNENFQNPDVKSTLEFLSIPQINTDRSHRSTHDQINNEKIVYKLHSYNYYNTSEDFVNKVFKRLEGEKNDLEPDFYLARQYNKNYRNWQDTRATQDFVEKTPKYELDRWGRIGDIDFAVRLDLQIIGEPDPNGNSYHWTVDFKTKLGQKLKDINFRKVSIDKLKLDKHYHLNRSAQYEPGKVFTNENTVLDDFSIKQTLIELIHDIIHLLANEDPNKALEAINLQNYDVNQINEDITNQIINEIKNKAKPKK